MRFTYLKQIPFSRSVLNVFKGYNHNLSVGAGEFYDMKNMTGEFFPILSPRGPRGVGVQLPQQPQSMVCQDGLCFVAGGVLYYGYDGQQYRIQEELSLTEGEKKMIPFGSYIIILPDKKYFNTKDPGDFGDIEAEFSLTVENPADVTYTLCDKEGVRYQAAQSATAPQDPEDGQYWLDTSNYMTDSTSALKQYSSALGSWNLISPTYVKIEAPGIGKPFAVGDWVRIGGEDVEPIRCLRGIAGEPHEILGKDDNAIVICYPIAEASKTVTETESLSVVRKMPRLDFVFEHENRLWGCRYGEDNKGSFVNEIYASKLGDFKNWNSFQGISTDSYVASCGTDGPWTGAIKALGYPLFFKEGYLHKVYGSYPGSYQIQTIPCRGVQQGCEKSLAVVNEVLFYKSLSGVCAYDGSLPACVSEKLGKGKYHDAVAGAVGNKYYICMKDEKDACHLFCFDTQKGLWHREDDLQVREFCSVGTELFYIEKDKPYIRVMPGGVGTKTEEKVSWYAETGVLGSDEADHKYLFRIGVRMSMEPGTRVRFLVQYDSSESWESLACIASNRLGSFTVPLRPRRCDHLRLRIEGEGDAKIYAITLCKKKGSELR